MAAQKIFHIWALEVWSLAASLAQFAMMFALMVHFDGKQTFDGSFATLNTMTSILSTGSRASLLTTVSSCIGQGNWAAFSTKPRRLYDFEMISESSRGPLGSVQLLINSRFKGGALVRFGAFLTLLSIATGPFAQQLARVRQIEFLEEGGSIAQGLSYSKGINQPISWTAVSIPGAIGQPGRMTVDHASIISKPDFSMRASLMFALSAAKRDVIRQADFECPGTGCLFENFRSLAICNRCYNASSMLGVTQQINNVIDSNTSQEYSVTRYCLPNGLYLENKDVFPKVHLPNNNQEWEPERLVLSLYGNSNPNKSINAREINTLIWSQSIIKVDNSTGIWQWPNMSVYAVECALYYCVKNYSFRVVHNTMELELENELKEYRRHPDSWQFIGQETSHIMANASSNLAFHPNQSAFERSDLQLSNDSNNSESFNISQLGAALRRWMIGKPPLDIMGLEDSPYYNPDLAPVMWFSENLPARFDSIAASMSNSLRSGDDLNSRFVGKVVNPVTVYKINWPWMSYQLFLQVAAVVFFAITVSISQQLGGRDIPVWKSSQLAVMSQGPLVSDVLKGAETIEELETVAKKTSIMLFAKEEDQSLIQLGAEESTDKTSLRRNSASD
ncbi:unnamed protein product [Clonostachys solani]|uniref:Uncharacterized protein n=1 Tax=Clonostachys solani TaxID=160281 RepID=A0A9P0EKD9_9HYPO|nr:unnamed protein product [Clonostachys solani]